MATGTKTLEVQAYADFSQALERPGRDGVNLCREWAALLPGSVSDVVFMTPQWLHTWWKHFGPLEGSQLHLLAVRDTERSLVGVVPLFIEDRPVAPVREFIPGRLRPEREGAPLRVVSLVGGSEVADYLDVVTHEENIRDVWAAALDYLMQIRADWDVIDLHSLPEWSPTHKILGELCTEAGLVTSVVPEDVCPVIILPQTADEYLMSLRKKDRHELRRKVRKLEGRDDVKWHLVPPTDAAAMHDAMSSFLDLHRKSGVDKAHFMDEDMARFFFELADDLLDTGWLDLAILEVDGQPAAAYFSFYYKKRLYLYNSGYDQKFASYSAGIALLAYRIQKAILQGCKYFDFLRGDEPYKYDFGGKNTFVYRVFAKQS